MVCTYCSGPTRVSNSRHQKTHNTVWRRRVCVACGATFTSRETADYERTLAVQHDGSHIVAFERDRLFLSLYEACRHRPTAVQDAGALCQTAIAQLEGAALGGIVTRDQITQTVRTVLGHFDQAAVTHYAAFHPSLASRH